MIKWGVFVCFPPENLEHMSVSDNRCMPIVRNLQEFSTQLPVNFVLPANTGGLVQHKRSLCLLSTITSCHSLSLQNWSCV